MDLRLLGPVEAFVDGRPVALGPPKQRALLAMLALETGRTVSGERLVDGLWGDKPPASATKMVQLYVSQLRRLMDGNGAEIVTRGRGYELRMPDDALDLGRFTGLFEAGRAREALLLWRGQPLADLSDQPFAAPEIQRLEELRLRAIERAIDDDLAAGRHAAVIGELDGLIAAHPLRERLHAQRMLAFYRGGRQSEALKAYRDARGVLVEEIGVEPGPELQRLQRAILEHDPSLDRPASAAVAAPPAPAPATAPGRPRRGVRRLALAAVPIAVAAAWAIVRLTGDTGLARIDENAVGVIDPRSGRITGQYLVGRGPGALVAGGGSVWVANSQDGTVARLRRGRQQVVTIDTGGEPVGVAFGAGSLWAADGEGRTVAQIDPYANKVVQRFDVGNAANAVAVGYGAVWAASAVDGTVARIDLARGRITHRIQAGARPTAIAAGGGGIWVASDVEASVVRIDPRSRTAVARIATGNAPSGIAVGAGAVWVSNRIDGNVSRIDPATDRVTDTIRVGREPRSVAADDRGVWVANAGDGTVVRLDPHAPRVVSRVRVGNSPAAVALADGEVWATAVPASATHRGGRLRATLSDDDGRLGTAPDPSAFDPLASLTHDGLVGYRRVGGAAAGALVPNLARTLPEPSPDELTYVFRLRAGVRFSDGRPVTPADVRASIERLIAVVSPAGGERYLPIRGVGRCSARRCDLSEAIDVDPVAGTLAIHLARPDPEFLHKLANALVVPAGTPLGRATGPLPGTGPYRLERWGPDGALFVRNRHFRVLSSDRPDGFPDEIAVSAMPSDAQVTAVERGTSDVAVFDSGFDHTVTTRARFGTRLHSDATPQTWFLFLDTRAPPFDDARARRALNYAVDRGRVAEILGSHETLRPTCQMLPPGFRGYSPSCPFGIASSAAGIWTAADLAKGRRLVGASGTRGMTVEFWGSRPWERLGRYVGSLLRRLGYRPRIRTFPDLAMAIERSMRRRGRTAQIGLMGWIADSAGPLNFISPLVSCAGTMNLSRFCDRRIDAAAQDAARARGAEGVGAWRDVEEALAKQSPTVPLANESWVSLSAKRVGNFQYHPFWGPLLDQMWVE